MPTVAELPSIADTRRPGRRRLLRPLIWSAITTGAADLAPLLDSDFTLVRAWSTPFASASPSAGRA
ncbi:MAG TPA: hypothetical protein VG652_09550 [Gaiellaceae bacterium]|nr:hypothetical protein [Gaiellaceae bacterium]